MTGTDELCKASARGERDKVKFLLQHGANVSGFNRFNRTALQVGLWSFSDSSSSSFFAKCVILILAFSGCYKCWISYF